MSPRPCVEGFETVAPEWQHTFGVEPLVGWRVWAVKTYHRLDGSDELRLSPISGDLLWQPHQRAVAVCTPGNYGRAAPHEAPQPNCQCGLWALASRLAAEEVYGDQGRGTPHVFGKVAMWGRVLEFERGFRAQYAYPLALYGEPDHEQSIRGLGDLYGVPVEIAEFRRPEPKPAPPAPPTLPRQGMKVYMRLWRHLFTDIDWQADTIRVTLHTSKYEPQMGSDEFFSQVGHEIAEGGGYPAGGIELQNKTFDRDEQRLEDHYRADPFQIPKFKPSQAFRYAVVRKDAGDPARSPLLACVDVGRDLMLNGEPFAIQWSSTGVISVSAD